MYFVHCLLLPVFYIYARYEHYYLKITFYSLDPYFQQFVSLFTVLPATAAERLEVHICICPLVTLRRLLPVVVNRALSLRARSPTSFANILFHLHKLIFSKMKLCHPKGEGEWRCRFQLNNWFRKSGGLEQLYESSRKCCRKS